MGATSGGDFLEALRARLDRDQFRVVSISASPRTPSAQEAGVVGFLRKPFDIAALEAVLDEHG
jgi:CheY-like chemotaxis protein